MRVGCLQIGLQLFNGVLQRFSGSSFAVDPYGRVLARAPEDDVALLLVDLDLDLVEQARRDMPFLRDRRPETYGPLSQY